MTQQFITMTITITIKIPVPPTPPQSGAGRTPTKRKRNRLPGTGITAWRKEKPYDRDYRRSPGGH